MKNPEFLKIPESARNVKTLVGGVVGVLLVFLLQQVLFSAQGIDKQLQVLADDYNKNCPMYVDSETRIDSVTVLPNKTIQFNYTLVHLTSDSIDIEAIKKQLEPGFLSYIKAPSLKNHRANKETFNFSFQDKNNHFLFVIQFTPDSYTEN